jgi:hypothetical protein
MTMADQGKGGKAAPATNDDDRTTGKGKGIPASVKVIHTTVHHTHVTGRRGK